jgi:alcohol dehydrogenase class IV
MAAALTGTKVAGFLERGTIEIGTAPTLVHFGPGSLAMLPTAMSQLERQRALIVCGRTVANGPMLTAVRRALEGRCVSVYPGVELLTPLTTVLSGTQMATRERADVLISVGGGSAIDTAKCIALMLASGGDWQPYSIRYDALGTEERRSLPPDTIPHIAVPTTTGSASEVMPGVGCLDLVHRRKLIFFDRHLTPKAAVLDPEMARFAPPMLTSASGMTAVARCVEALYSRDRQPFSSGLALQGLRLLSRALPQAAAEPDHLEARHDCQLGCLLSGVAVVQAMASVVHALGHVLAGRYRLQHGLAHAILLAPAMRLLLPQLDEDQHLIAHAVGIASEGMHADMAGRAAADAIDRLLAGLPLPKRLRDVGVVEADLEAIAAAGLGDHMIAYSPRPLGANDLLELVRSVW